MGSPHWFPRKCLPHTPVWKSIVCLSVVLSNKNGIENSMKENNSYFSLECNCTNAFPWNDYSMSVCRSVLCILILSCRILKYILKGWDWINLIICIASSRAFIRETGFFFSTSAWQWRRWWKLTQFGTAAIHAKVPAVLHTIAFAPSVHKSTQ